MEVAKILEPRGEVSVIRRVPGLTGFVCARGKSDAEDRNETSHPPAHPQRLALSGKCMVRLHGMSPYGHIY
jgi:hypothetical protein